MDSQLNSLVDLIINLGNSLNYYQNKLNLVLEKRLKETKDDFEELKSLTINKKPKNKNLDYIKDQNWVILEKLSKINLKLIKEELNMIKKEIYQKKHLIS